MNDGMIGVKPVIEEHKFTPPGIQKGMVCARLWEKVLHTRAIAA
jgi:hypothetical protein